MAIEYEHEYPVDGLLDRAYDTFTLDKGKVKLERPQLVNKDRKSYIPNFVQMAESVNRSPDELKIYFQDELRIVTSFKEDKRLKIDKMVKKTMIDSIFKSYVIDYVMCKACKSIKTHVEREKRIKFLICETCKCRKSVQ